MGYIPPEALNRGRGVQISTDEQKKGDVYAFGVLMCFILSGADPFADMTEGNIVVMVVAKHERPAIPAIVDEDPQTPVFKEMIQRLWHHDLACRSDFATIVEQLREHVADPKLRQSLPRKFMRTLPRLIAGGCLFVLVGSKLAG